MHVARLAQRQLASLRGGRQSRALPPPPLLLCSKPGSAAAAAAVSATQHDVMSEIAPEPCTDAEPCSLCRIAKWREAGVLVSDVAVAGAAAPNWPRMFEVSAPLHLRGPLLSAVQSGGGGGDGSLEGAISREYAIPPGTIVDIGGGALAVLVTSPGDVPMALAWLDADPHAAAMAANASGGGGGSSGNGRPPLALDLEWLADTGGGRRPRGVALVQLASSPLRCALFHTAAMDFELPAELEDLLTGVAGRLLLTQGWDQADAKMLDMSFDLDVEQGARHIVDLQDASGAGMGYVKLGLVALGQRLLHPSFTKSRRMSMSNWERKDLTGAQVRYAALDVLVAYGIYRALAASHARAVSGVDGADGGGAACGACGQPHGAPRRAGVTYACTHPGCDADPLPLRRVMGHAITAGHAPGVVEDECQECGRVFARYAAADDIARWRDICAKRQERVRLQEAQQKAAAQQQHFDSEDALVQATTEA